MKIAILGGGFTGLLLGRSLKDLGIDFIILEKESGVGGLCRTNKTGDYYWDFAVHAIYCTNIEVLEYFYSLPIDYQHLDRNVKIFHSGGKRKKYMIDYPFETGIKDLPLSHRFECMAGYIVAQIKSKKNCSNFEEWIINNFGVGIAKHFMTDYNNKIWNCGLSEISENLATSRVSKLSITEFISSAFGKRVVGRPHQAKFLYPKKGLQSIINYIANDIRESIILNSNVNRIIKNGNAWNIYTQEGRKIEVDFVISTIPLVELINSIEIAEIKKEYDVFKWNNTFFVMIGLKRGFNFRLVNDCHWVFFKEEEIFYRITLMHNFNPNFLPCLVAEVTQKGDVTLWPEEKVKDRVINDLLRLGIIDSTDSIAATDVKLLSYTYPIPTVGLETIKMTISNALEKRGLFLVGRNGNWDYINMEDIILNVKKFVNQHYKTFKPIFPK
jgi:protoporphyrinogen oxidase